MSGREFGVWIGQQFEIEPFLRAEILVRLRSVHTPAKNYRTRFLILRQIALEIVCFHGAAAGEIFRIKIEHNPFAAIIFQAHLRAVASSYTEIRPGFPNSPSI